MDQQEKKKKQIHFCFLIFFDLSTVKETPETNAREKMHGLVQ